MLAAGLASCPASLPRASATLLVAVQIETSWGSPPGELPGTIGVSELATQGVAGIEDIAAARIWAALRRDRLREAAS